MKSRTVLFMLLALLPACEPTIPAPEKSGTHDIPVALQGRWGLVPADCTSTLGDAKGLLVISDTAFKFYESRATVAQIDVRSANHLDGDFDFSGEGMSWTYRETFDVQNAGQTLLRREYGVDEAMATYRYQRCAE